MVERASARTRVVRCACVVATAAAVVLLAGCSSGTATVPASDSVEQHLSTLVDVASPGAAWSRATAADLSRVLVGSVAVPATVAGVPVAYVDDADGVHVGAISGWAGTAPQSGEAELCRTAQSWMASAEDTYGLVSGMGGIVDACATVPPLSASSTLPIPLSSECAPSASGEVSTCVRVDADRSPSGELRLTATVSLQADTTRAPSWQPAVGSSH